MDVQFDNFDYECTVVSQCGVALLERQLEDQRILMASVKAKELGWRHESSEAYPALGD